MRRPRILLLLVFLAPVTSSAAPLADGGVGVLTCVLQALARAETTFPPLYLLVAPPPYASPNAEAFVTRDPAAIYLVSTTDAFGAAARSRCADRLAIAKIASILVHEEAHLRDGADEERGYREQLAALIRLGVSVDATVYRDVERSMRLVLRREDERRSRVAKQQRDGRVVAMK